MSRISRSAVRRWHTAGVGSEIDADGSEDLEADLISLTIPAAMEYVRLVRIGAASIGRRRGLSVRAIDDLRLAVDEVFALLLDGSDHHGSVDVTFEVDDHELLDPAGDERKHVAQVRRLVESRHDKTHARNLARGVVGVRPAKAGLNRIAMRRKRHA